MLWRLKRGIINEHGVFGGWISPDGDLLAVTLEHAYLDSDGNVFAKIPVGQYTCRRRLSPKFGYDVFELIDVPGHNFVEIHRGNVNADSDGCILLGNNIENDQIMNSKVTFERFMNLMEGVNEFQLDVS
jgi:hypothetical protein